MRIFSNKSSREITTLPGCSQVSVFHGAFVRPEYRNKGYGLAEHSNTLQKAKKMMYDYALCTVDMTNIPELMILDRAGWRQLDKFQSTKTGHIVGLYGKSLPYEE